MGKMVGACLQGARESFGLDLGTIAHKLDLHEEVDIEKLRLEIGECTFKFLEFESAWFNKGILARELPSRAITQAQIMTKA